MRVPPHRKQFLNANAALAFVALVLPCAAQTIQFENGVFAISGWRVVPPATGDDWSSFFAVYAGGSGSPPMIGTYAVEGDRLVFHPRFPPADGVRYRVIFQPPNGTPQEAWFDGPKRDKTPVARVIQVYPSADVLPSNTLKMYVEFSTPMSRGEAWKRIRMLDSRGEELPEPFLVIEQELWDPTNQRLTLLFDPGRIKRGLALNAKLGPPIVEGRDYVLMIDQEWQDAQGRPMREGYRKLFRGGPADRSVPAIGTWKVTAPRAGSSDALVVNFPKAMDFALVQRLIDVPGVAGHVTIDRFETEWRFTPDQPWKAGSYRLAADTLLEDIAGNHLDRPFDVDIKETGPQKFSETKVSLPFQVR